MSKQKNIASISIVVAALCLSLTSFYSVGYILLIVLLSQQVSTVGIFKTFIQKFVLFACLLAAIIPITGLLCWILHIPMEATYNHVALILISLGLFGITKNLQAVGDMKFLEKVDVIAIGAAVLPVLILIITFGSAPNSKASLFQLSSEGWDNGSHILMMEANSGAKGYAYGPYDELKDVLIETFNAYPQSWHLATSHLANGFGANRFISSNPMGVILAYTIATTVWLMLLIYIFTFSMWRFFERLTKRSPNLTEVSTMMAICILATIVIFIAAFMHGFTNYIGTLVYICLSIAMMLDFIKKDDLRYYFLFVIFSLAAVLSWFLVLPAIAVAFIMLIFSKYGNVKKGFFAIIHSWKMVTVTLAAGAIALLQVYIFRRFSVVEGGDQLNTGSSVTPFDVIGSPFHISHILFGLVVVVYVAFLFKKSFDYVQASALLAIAIPWLTLVIFVYLYQNVTVGQNSYYLTKTMGLCLATILIPVGALLAAEASKIRLSSPAFLAPLLSLLIVFTILLGTGQPLYGLNKLFPENARTTYGTAEKVVQYLPKTTAGKAYIVILTGRKSYENSREDNHGKLEMRVVQQRFNCTYYITGYTSVTTAVKKLDKCASEPYMQDKTIYVLTSRKSDSKVRNLGRSNIVAIKTW